MPRTRGIETDIKDIGLAVRQGDRHVVGHGRFDAVERQFHAGTGGVGRIADRAVLGDTDGLLIQGPITAKRYVGDHLGLNQVPPISEITGTGIGTVIMPADLERNPLEVEGQIGGVSPHHADLVGAFDDQVHLIPGAHPVDIKGGQAQQVGAVAQAGGV